MYQNKVTLIGFLGSNPEARTNNQDLSITALSLATKSSYKKDDKYISHTEWHRCIVFGKLSEFAKTLTKGAHVQVEGGTTQPGVREQEDGLEAARLGNSGRFDPKAGPRRKGHSGRSGSR
jgi:single stranded DNA-binding protein